MARKTERERFISQLKKAMNHATSAVERVEARKMYERLVLNVNTQTGDIAIDAPGKAIEQGPEDSNSSGASKPQVPSAYSGFFETEDVTSICSEGRALRAEAEGFVAWRRVGDAAQETYAADWSRRQKSRAAAWRTAFETQCNNSTAIFNHIWGEKNKGQYPAEITKQALIELGLEVPQEKIL